MFKFQFEKIKNGFRITNTVTTSQADIVAREFTVSVIDVARNKQDVNFGRTDYNFAQYRDIQKDVIHKLLQEPFEQGKFYIGHPNCNFTVPQFWLDQNGGEEQPMPKKIKKWIVGKALYCIRKRFAEHWHKMIDKNIDPELRQLSRSINAACGPNRILFDELVKKLKSSKYLISDMISYPAACYALRWATRDFDRRGCGLDNWMGLYSDTGKTYKALNKTLMAMPRRMHCDVLVDIARVHLDEALYGRSKILFALDNVFTGDQYWQDNQGENRHAGIFRKSSNDDIIRAARMARYRGLDFRMNRLQSIMYFKRWLSDYPDPYNGNLKGLFMRSYKWHNDPRNFQARTSGGVKYTSDKKLAEPPWGEIGLEGVEWLSTVGHLEMESSNMKHCVGSYAYRCVNGNCYIYHIEHGRKRATVEVSPSGRILQARGPCNELNDACHWAQKELHKAINEKIKESGIRVSDNAVSYAEPLPLEELPF